MDESREKHQTNGQTNGQSNGASHDDAGSSSSDEEVKKRIVVEISPLVTYAGEVMYYYTQPSVCLSLPRSPSVRLGLPQSASV